MGKLRGVKQSASSVRSNRQSLYCAKLNISCTGTVESMYSVVVVEHLTNGTILKLLKAMVIW